MARIPNQAEVMTSQLPRWVVEPVHIVTDDKDIVPQGYCITRTDRPNHYIYWAKGDMMIVSRLSAQRYANRLNNTGA
jgi:hypothetical protein